MPRVTISEYDTMPEDVSARPMPMTGKPTYSKKYAPVLGTPLKVDIVSPSTRFVRIATSVDLHIGQDATATEDDPYMPAGSVETIGVNKGYVSILMVEG